MNKSELLEIRQVSNFQGAGARTRAQHVAAVGITAVSFDPYHELVWTGNDAGYVASFYGLVLHKYTAFRVHDSQIRQIIVTESGVVTIAANEVRLTNRRGLAKWRLSSDSTQDLHCGIILPSSKIELLVAGQQPKILVVNLIRGFVVKEIETDTDIVVMRPSRSIVCGGMRGEVTLRDPRTLEVEHKIQAHSAMISDAEVVGNQLLTCGYSKRQEHFVLDPLVKVYDMRAMRSLAPLAFPGGPCLLRAHPKLSTTVFVASQSGYMQLCDIGNVAAHFQYNQINTRGYVTCVDVSSTGELVGIGDSAGCLHLWGWDANNAKMSLFPKELELPSPAVCPSLTFDENTPLNAVGMPYYSEMLFSASWPASWTFEVGRPAPPIDPEVLASMKMIDFVGYAPNPGKKLRNQVVRLSKRGANNAKSPGGPKFRSEQAKMMYYGQGSDMDSQAEDEPSPISPTGLSMPRHYKRVEIKYSKFGVEDFDFGFYNKTRFGGLETHIKNSYCNSLLHVLFFNPPLRQIAKSHIGQPCPKEFCLTCELGFLFRMLEDANGQNCQATNFLRAFGTIPQAAALGLFEPEQPSTSTSYSALIQAVNRFIFEQIHQECNWPGSNPQLVLGAGGDSQDVPSVIQQVFGLKTVLKSVCECSEETIRTTYPFVVDLVLPKKRPAACGRARDPTSSSSSTSFASLLQSSFRRDSTTKAWCAKCQRYQLSKQTKRLQGFPAVLAVNLAASDRGEFERYSAREVEVTGRPWLPAHVAVAKQDDEFFVVNADDQDGRELNGASKRNQNSGRDVVSYELTAVVSQVQGEGEVPHLVAHVKIPKVDRHKLDPNSKHKGSWCFFNDFLVKRVPELDVLQPRGPWKTPALIHYTRVNLDEHVDSDALPSTVDKSILYEGFSIGKNTDTVNRTFVPLTREEGPKRGFLCAIDAEFVALNREETEIHSDGTRALLRPSRHTLARVSVLRGEGEFEGVPFIDDYIATSDPIVDYLTEFSGITEADLDPNITTQTLVPLKVAYKKLRSMVDMGVVFIGHGLVKDFRIINILVPPEQVIDTVNIWHIPNKQRKISLRFLAWYLLKQDIQQDAHDSIEDARTALLLYKKYVELHKEGTFARVLDELYAEGRKCSWKPWGSPPAGGPSTSSITECPSTPDLSAQAVLQTMR